MEVEHLAQIVGIEQLYAGATPEEKLKLVSAESAQHKTLFVGDGINDAPAMLAATASVALGGQNSDVTAEAADAVVMDSSLRKVDELIHIARRTRSIAPADRNRRHDLERNRNVVCRCWMAASTHRSSLAGDH